jgi:hypothetical protein
MRFKPKQFRCPSCGRDLTRTASGRRLCAYAEDHPEEVPYMERTGK